ncbi:uncharacterized protein LAESUDRAFT_446632 [Laetiporus sulphureus 93-53]|uniref:Uncharacterized protein n=1 Tax=Laetiporus sulphureus 93-53 TaxID=1314785 RepID=A0A165BY17_9APHY|nr:uncharacterized protein LAESUDRAFT_446632 [Laetiporus sulphureus 93-53]KZT01858.1 hypothetical protein LAESUDRAFT_446632 [Laetiporus sulphureus 93-53]
MNTSGRYPKGFALIVNVIEPGAGTNTIKQHHKCKVAIEKRLSDAGYRVIAEDHEASCLSKPGVKVYEGVSMAANNWMHPLAKKWTSRGRVGLKHIIIWRARANRSDGFRNSKVAPLDLQELRYTGIHLSLVTVGALSAGEERVFRLHYGDSAPDDPTGWEGWPRFGVPCALYGFPIPRYIPPWEMYEDRALPKEKEKGRNDFRIAARTSTLSPHAEQAAPAVSSNPSSTRAQAPSGYMQAAHPQSSPVQQPMLPSFDCDFNTVGGHIYRKRSHAASDPQIPDVPSVPNKRARVSLMPTRPSTSCSLSWTQVERTNADMDTGFVIEPALASSAITSLAPLDFMPSDIARDIFADAIGCWGAENLNMPPILSCDDQYAYGDFMESLTPPAIMLAEATSFEAAIQSNLAVDHTTLDDEMLQMFWQYHADMISEETIAAQSAGEGAEDHLDTFTRNMISGVDEGAGKADDTDYTDVPSFGPPWCDSGAAVEVFEDNSLSDELFTASQTSLPVFAVDSNICGYHPGDDDYQDLLELMLHPSDTSIYNAAVEGNECPQYQGGFGYNVLEDGIDDPHSLHSGGDLGHDNCSYAPRDFSEDALYGSYIDGSVFLEYSDPSASLVSEDLDSESLSSASETTLADGEHFNIAVACDKLMARYSSNPEDAIFDSIRLWYNSFCTETVKDSQAEYEAHDEDGKTIPDERFNRPAMADTSTSQLT